MINSISIKKRVGFTIIELLIYMGILSILLYVLTDIFISSLEVKTQSESQASLQQDGRFILGKLMYDINQATAINYPALGEQSNSLTIVIDNITYTYTLDNGNLQLTNNFGTNNLNSYNTQLSNLSFLHLGNQPTAEKLNPRDNIKINFNLSSKTIINSGQETLSFQTTVGLR